MTFTRMQTSQSRLQIPWQQSPDEGFFSVDSLESALEFLAQRSGGKPVLINRETERRDPKVAKLYKEALASERFALAAHWFCCIKVGDEVLDENHPLSPLFSGSNPPALVLMSPDGKKRVAFLGTVQQRVAWTPIANMLATAYEKDPTAAVKGLEKLLCTFDKIDSEQSELKTQLERATKRRDQGKIAAVQQRIAAADARFKEALAEEEKLRALVLRGAEKAAPAGDPAGDAGNG